MDRTDPPAKVASNAQLGPTSPKLTIEQVCNIGFAVLRAHNDDRLWQALTEPGYLATPAPIAWYSPRHGDTITDKQKTERAAYLPLDAAAYSVQMFTGALVAPTEDEAQVEFEAWVSSLPSAEEINLIRAKFGRFHEYVDRTTECMFDTWRAARAHGIKP